MKSLLLLIILLAAYSSAFAKTVRVGEVFAIHERSIVETIQAHLADRDIGTTLEQFTRSFELGIEVPVATETKEFSYTPWYTLQHDIRNEKNQVLFPAGFRFNPLELHAIRAPGRVLFFNEDQIEWVIAEAKHNDHLVLTKGDIYETTQLVGRRVFLLDKVMHERLQVSAVPSIYEQKLGDKFFTVNHYAL